MPKRFIICLLLLLIVLVPLVGCSFSKASPTPVPTTTSTGTLSPQDMSTRLSPEQALAAYLKLSEPEKKRVRDTMSPAGLANLNQMLQTQAAPPPTRTPIPPPLPTAMYSTKEVEAVVYDYLKRQCELTDKSTASRLLVSLSNCRSKFVAVYHEPATWQIWALGYSGSRLICNSGLWLFYERTGIVEPGNSEASTFLVYLQSRRP